MSKKDCRDCPDRFVRKDEDGHWTTCHATCPTYAAMVEERHKISEARSKINDKRTFQRLRKNHSAKGFDGSLTSYVVLAHTMGTV